MAHTGIRLGDRAEVICEGTLLVEPREADIYLKAHDHLVLALGAERTDISLREASLDTASGFYSVSLTPEIGDLDFCLPAAASVFLQNALQAPRSQHELRFSLAGDPETLGAGRVQFFSSDRQARPFGIRTLDMTVQPLAEGMGLAIHCDLVAATGSGKTGGRRRSRSPGPTFQLRAKCLLSTETVSLRFDHQAARLDKRPGLRRPFPGDEVQTSLTGLNISHPLVMNMGGTFALSRQGVHAVEVDSTGAFIQPVTLSGWGWGSVYASDRLEGRQELHLPWLTRSLLTEIVHRLARKDNEAWRATVNRTEGELGHYTEDGTPPRLNSGDGLLNRRRVNQLRLDTCLDTYGLTLAIDAALSEVLPETRHDRHPPSQSGHYQRTLLMPWEVLILRGFDFDAYRDVCQPAGNRASGNRVPTPRSHLSAKVPTVLRAL